MSLSDLFRSRVSSIIGVSLDSAIRRVDTNRIADAAKAIAYYDGINAQIADLVLAYSSQYSSSQDWRNRVKSVYNLTSCISEAVSTLYQDTVRRTFSVPALSDMWSEVEGFDATMQAVDVYTLLTGTVAVRPIWTEEGTIEHAVYTSDQIEVIPYPEDPTKAQSVILTWKVGENTVQHIWTKDRFIEAVEDEVLVDDANPYGRIPLVFFTNRKVLGGVFDVPAADLVRANLVLNKMITDLNYTVQFQTHGQLVIQGAPQSFQPSSGPSTYLKIPADANSKAYYINPNADVDKSITAINLNIKMFLMSRRIPESAVVAEKHGEAGVAIVAKQLALADYRKRRQNQFRSREVELVRLTLDVMKVHQTGGHIASNLRDVEVAVKYQDIKAPMDQQSVNEWSWRFQNRINTPIDYLMHENPEMTEEEAQKEYDENKAFFAQNTPNPAPGPDGRPRAATDKLKGLIASKDGLPVPPGAQDGKKAGEMTNKGQGGSE